MKKAEEVKPEIVAYLITIGLERLEKKKYSLAICTFNQVINLDFTSTAAYLGRGYAYYYLEDFKTAISDFTLAVRFDPESAASYFWRGLTWAKLENFRLAIQDLEQVLALNAECYFTYLNLGTLYLQIKGYQKALDNYNQALRIEPKAPLTYLNRGVAHFELGLVFVALFDFETAALLYLEQRDQSNYLEVERCLSSRAEKLVSKQDWQKALLYLNAIIKFNPNAETFVDRSIIYATLAQPEAALADLERALSLQCDNADAYYNRALVLLSLGEYETALGDLALAIELEPDSMQPAYNKRSWLHLQLKNYSEAIADARSSVHLFPLSVAAHHALGDAYSGAGDLPLAIKSYRQAAILCAQTGNLSEFSKFLAYAQDLQQVVDQIA